jgi:hypothetical protein
VRRRTYTVAEIDRMRTAIQWTYPPGVAYMAVERLVWVEERLRTYIMAGIDPLELEAHASRFMAQLQQPLSPGGSS